MVVGGAIVCASLLHPSIGAERGKRKGEFGPKEEAA